MPLRIALLLSIVLPSRPARAWWGSEKKSQPVYVNVDDDATDGKPGDSTDTPAEKDPQAELKDIVAKVKRGELPRIEFDFDSDKIRYTSEPTLDAIAELMLKNPSLKLMVRAHTDSVGTDDYNLDLSRRRANSVVAYLIQKGVPPTFVRGRGLGSSEPIADNSTDEGRAKNRRVEFRVTFRDWDSIY